MYFLGIMVIFILNNAISFAMALLEFKDLSFMDKGDSVRFFFLKMFYFDIKKEELLKIGDLKISRNSLEFKGVSEKAARNKLNRILEKGFSSLKSRIGNKKAVYIHKNSGIPLIGTNYFGIVDRGTNILEIKPITGCNFNCIYCSVDEGCFSRKKVDFVVEKDYLVNEVKKVVEYKRVDGIEAHINAQGEPLLYADIAGLVKDIADMEQITTISIDTNGALLTKELADRLIEAGLTRFNLSLNSMDNGLAQHISDTKFDFSKVKEIAKYISDKADLIITPVWLPGINDSEIGKLIGFTKELQNDKQDVSIGIQNFLPYKSGRNPVKSVPLGGFYDMLRKLEKEKDIPLILDESTYNIVKTRSLPKPFKKGDIVDANIACDGRMDKEKLAVSAERAISIPHCHKEGKVKVKITRAKHNVFMGVSSIKN